MGGRFSSPLLFFNDGFDRTNLKAASAIGAFLFVDHIRLSFLNGICRTFFRTGSTGHTFIGDHISHRHHLPQLPPILPSPSRGEGYGGGDLLNL